MVTVELDPTPIDFPEGKSFRRQSIGPEGSAVGVWRDIKKGCLPEAAFFLYTMIGAVGTRRRAVIPPASRTRISTRAAFGPLTNKL